MDPNLRQRIIDEAYKLFITKGIRHTSFCDIAIAVNKSKGAVMHYFPSKKQLVNTVVETCFFPTSQLSSEMKILAEKGWSEFVQYYKNPIERAIGNFPEKTDNVSLIHYMQFVSSASQYVDGFPHMYQNLLKEEQRFLYNVISKENATHSISIRNLKKISRQTFEMSIGNTFLKLISFK